MMAENSEFYRMAQRVRNWGRWGPDDQWGTLNFITSEKIAAATRRAERGKIFPLGVEFGSAGPQGNLLYRGNPLHMMTVLGGSAEQLVEFADGWDDNPKAQQLAATFAAGPMRFNDDVIVMPLQAATQWDALAHVYYDGELYNGFPANSVTAAGAARCSIDAVVEKGIVSRGVLLDVVAYRRDLGDLERREPILPEELTAIARRQDVQIERGDIVLIHTGWWDEWRRTGNRSPAVAGLSWRCAEWLAEHEVAAVAADNMAVEHQLTRDVAGVILPMHLLCLRDMGLMLGEFWNTTELAVDCASDGVYDFLLVAPPLKITGAVGSPVNPIAMK